jgi:uncharacterized membrane protein (UPF0182 family)
MISLLLARADGANYGQLVAYTFPKQKLVFGPRNIDARINQDPIISQQISLWNQQGNRVLRGSLLAIPIDESLVYVLPLYLAAEQTGALPELRRVVVAYGNQIAMEPSLEAALQRIFGGRLRTDSTTPAAAAAPGARPPTVTDAVLGLVERAWDAWSKAQDALRRGDWSGYGQEQKRLEDTLRQLRERR